MAKYSYEFKKQIVMEYLKGNDGFQSKGEKRVKKSSCQKG